MRHASLSVVLTLMAACTSSQPEGPLDAVLSQGVEEGAVAGVVGLVTGPDSILYRGAFGAMDASGQEPMRKDAIFQIFSMTKPVTSVAAMMLVEQGMLGLDDDAASYLPEFADREVLTGIHADSSFTTRPAERPVTVRDLMRHTSGLGYTFSSPRLLEWTEVTGLPMFEQPLLHDPGERWSYGSNTYFVGRIIEEVSGETISDFLESRVLIPLGMDNTSYQLSPANSERLVALHTRREDGGLEGVPRPDTYEPIMIRGDGGLLSTAEDYGRFIRFLLRQGELDGTRLLTPETISEMSRDHLEPLDVTVTQQPGAIPARSRPFPLGANRDGFGLGFQVDAPDNPSARSAGSLSWAGLWNTHFWVDPENDVGAVLLTQLLPFYDDLMIDMLTSFERTLYEHLQ